MRFLAISSTKSAVSLVKNSNWLRRDIVGNFLYTPFWQFWVERRKWFRSKSKEIFTVVIDHPEDFCDHRYTFWLGPIILFQGVSVPYLKSLDFHYSKSDSRLGQSLTHDQALKLRAKQKNFLRRWFWLWYLYIKIFKFLLQMRCIDSLILDVKLVWKYFTDNHLRFQAASSPIYEVDFTFLFFKFYRRCGFPC